MRDINNNVLCIMVTGADPSPRYILCPPSGGSELGITNGVFRYEMMGGGGLSLIPAPYIALLWMGLGSSQQGWKIFPGRQDAKKLSRIPPRDPENH